MQKQLTPAAFWGLAIGGIVLIGGILFYVFRGSDPAAQGPIATQPFDRANVESGDAIKKRDEALARLGSNASVPTQGPTSTSH